MIFALDESALEAAARDFDPSGAPGRTRSILLTELGCIVA